MAKLEIKLTNLNKIREQVKKIGTTKVKVGVLAGATYPNGTAVAEVAKYLEYGWTQSVTLPQRGWLGYHGIHVKVGSVLTNPPRPFFQMTYKAKKFKWQTMGQNALKGLTSDPNLVLNKITQALTMLGLTAQQDLQETIVNGGVGGNSFTLRSPMTLALYGNLMQEGGHKTDGTPNQTTTQKPLYKSGLLESSISFEIVKDK